jgi:CheY-like chemotaxis protein
VELQEGKIWVESVERNGSTFFVELPLLLPGEQPTTAVAIDEEKLKEMAAALSGLKILLAEDNAFNVMVAVDDLNYYISEVKIDVAANGNVAVNKYQSENYDLILMDIQMPEMNGREASRKIRELEAVQGRQNPIPIIAMTASLLKLEIDLCYEAGMTNYIPKPYKIEELIGAIYSESQKAGIF